MEAISLIAELLKVGIPVVAKQVKLIRGAPQKVQSLHDELRFIDKSLNQYDATFMEDNTVKEWFTQIQNLALEARDIIDAFKTTKHTQDQRKPVIKLLYAWPHGAKLRRIAIKVNKIKEKIEEIDGYVNKYCLNDKVANPNRNSDWLEKQRREVEEENVVGFDGATEQVSNMLLTKTLRRDVISIVGTTGSGKTTLAKRIYGAISKEFQYHAWVFVPSKYSTRDLLLGILGKEETSKLDDIKLTEKLRSFLQGKRYLIVMDGVEATQLWEALEKDKLFPNEKHGSRVLLTTRSKYVASLASSSNAHIHNMKPLDDEARWKLLEKLVFKDERCPHQLARVGKQIAAKCAGLPLAIVSLASLLARDIAYLKWLDVLSNTSWYLNQQDSPPCFGILDLTYETTIPQHVKKCLLYLGVFPEGFEISARQVINLWIAEELIHDIGRSKAEEIAGRYLDELISLCLIEVARKRSDGGVRTFQIHELWRQFCVCKSERMGFLQVHTKLGSYPLGNLSWRLSIHYDLRYILSNGDNLPNLRSLLCFHNKDSLDPKGFTLDFDRFPRLRVLDVGYATSVSKVHENIKRSSLLKYLKISHPLLNRLPPSICSLPNLQTLDIKTTCVPFPRLPSRIWGMQELRHLLLPRQTTLPKCPDQSRKCLSHLQTLSAITPDENTADLIIGSRLPNLIKLTLNSQDTGKTKRCLEWLFKLKCLQKLKIMNPVVFPISETLPASLVKVTLVKTNLVADDVMRMLKNLGHLQVLKLLTKSIRGPKLEMRADSFPQLRFLFMEQINISTWMIGDGAMDSLEELTISQCHELELLPKQLGQLHNIRLVKVKSPSQSLKRELQQLSMKRCDLQIHLF